MQNRGNKSRQAPLQNSTLLNRVEAAYVCEDGVATAQRTPHTDL